MDHLTKGPRFVKSNVKLKCSQLFLLPLWLSAQWVSYPFLRAYVSHVSHRNTMGALKYGPRSVAAPRFTLFSLFLCAFGAKQFLGVPFAQPPTGDLRWESPVSPARYPGGSLKAQGYKQACMQSNGMLRRYSASEQEINQIFSIKCCGLCCNGVGRFLAVFV
jgi:hypothetical protein